MLLFKVGTLIMRTRESSMLTEGLYLVWGTRVLWRTNREIRRCYWLCLLATLCLFKFYNVPEVNCHYNDSGERGGGILYPSGIKQNYSGSGVDFRENWLNTEQIQNSIIATKIFFFSFKFSMAYKGRWCFYNNDNEQVLFILIVSIYSKFNMNY